jgi:ABC-type nitrate/sulfonate/bicarbonate transport system substrate-binding protein
MVKRSTRLPGAALAGVLLMTATGAVAAQEHAILAIPGVNVLFLVQYVAEDEHLWAKQGLDVEIRHINGIGSMNAVIAGSADFSMSSGPSITRANSRGQKLTALSTAIDQSGQDLVIRKDIAEAAHFDANAPIAERARILKGRTFSVGGVAAIPDIVLKAVAHEAGIGPNEVTVAPMQPQETMAALARKAIDGMAIGPPYIQQAVLNGSGVIVTDAAKGEPTKYSPVSAALLLARADYCPAHQSICAKMVHGVFEAVTLIRTDRAVALKVMEAHFGKFYSAPVLAAAYDMVKAMTPEKPTTSPKWLENSDNMNVAAGFLKPEQKLPRYDTIIDNSYVK